MYTQQAEPIKPVPILSPLSSRHPSLHPRCSGHNGLSAIPKQMQFHDCPALHNYDFKSHDQEYPFNLNQLTNFQPQFSYCLYLLMKINAILLCVSHSPCTLLPLQPKFPEGNTLGGWATGSHWNSMVSKNLLDNAEVHPMGLQAPTPRFSRRPLGAWLEDTQGERQRATAMASTCWREINPS